MAKSKSRKKSRAKEKDSNWQERVVQIRRVRKVVKGGKKCGRKAELFDDYVIKDCSSIWKNICRQGPGQPAE